MSHEEVTSGHLLNEEQAEFDYGIPSKTSTVLLGL
jgi:hypothetical protein